MSRSQTTHNATTSTTWQLNADEEGPQIKDLGSGVMGVRNGADTDAAPLSIAEAADDAHAVNRTYHPKVRQLIHFIEHGPSEGFATGAYFEVLPTGDPFPTSEIWYESAAKAKKIVELATVWYPNKTINTETWTVYDTDGITPLGSVTDTYAYSGVFVSSITRAIT